VANPTAAIATRIIVIPTSEIRNFRIASHPREPCHCHHHRDS
jgi:hypothetical protein